MDIFKTGEHDVLTFLRPDTLLGALFYLGIFLLLGLLAARILRVTVHAAMTREGHVDRAGIGFVQQLGTVLIWVVIIILYAHLIPVLRNLGTALLAGAGVASVVLGLAAQSTLGNLVAGISITIYRPFRVGDTLQVTAPTGTEIGVVQSISLGYTTLVTPDGRSIVLPNSIAANQVILNLSRTYAPSQMSIALRFARDTDLEQACGVAVSVAREVLGDGAVKGCFLTKVDAGTATFDLRVQPPGSSDREALRATLLSRLMQRFAANKVAASAMEPPTFA
jgi:small conductance mechanosensitive channel